jgi:hypothetical protein
MSNTSGISTDMCRPESHQEISGDNRCGRAGTKMLTHWTAVLIARRKLNICEEPREKLLLMASHSDSLLSRYIRRHVGGFNDHSSSPTFLFQPCNEESLAVCLAASRSASSLLALTSA